LKANLFAVKKPLTPRPCFPGVSEKLGLKL